MKSEMTVEQTRNEVIDVGGFSDAETLSYVDNLIAAVRAEQQKQIDALQRRLSFLEGPDTEESDGTDAAHPAYWRGEKAGADGVIARLTDDLDGGKRGVCNEPLESLRVRIAALTAERDAALSRVAEVEADNGRLAHAQSSAIEDRIWAQKQRDALAAKVAHLTNALEAEQKENEALLSKVAELTVVLETIASGITKDCFIENLGEAKEIAAAALAAQSTKAT